MYYIFAFTKLMESIKDLIIDEKEKNNQDLFCPICKNFLDPNKTQQTECLHMFCKECVEKLCNNEIYESSNKCPICRTYISSNRIVSLKKVNLFAYNYLSNIKIRCRNEECGEEFAFSQRDKHYSKCLYEKVECSLCNNKEFIRKDFHKHLLEDKDTHIIQLVEKVMHLEKKIDKMKKRSNI